MSTGERYVSRETIAAPGDHSCSHPEARRRLISVHVREGKATHNLSWSLTRKACGGPSSTEQCVCPQTLHCGPSLLQRSDYAKERHELRDDDCFL